MELKLELFADIERSAPPAAVVATNTSALSITEMAGSLKNPARVAGMHFFNPVHKMKLIEIVRALESSPEALATIEAVARAMGKETVLVQRGARLHHDARQRLDWQRSVLHADGGRRIGARHRQGAQARPQPSDGPVRAGRSRRPRHAAQHPRVPAQVDGREVPSLPAARAVREGRPARQEGRQGRLRVPDGDPRATGRGGIRARRGREPGGARGRGDGGIRAEDRRAAALGLVRPRPDRDLRQAHGLRGRALARRRRAARLRHRRGAAR